MNEKEFATFAEVLVQAASGKDIECRSRSGANNIWVQKTDFDDWFPGKYFYRVSSPAKPREVWVNFSRSYPAIWAYNSKEEALSQIQPDYYYADKAVHFKEVTENEKVE